VVVADISHFINCFAVFLRCLKEYVPVGVFVFPALAYMKQTSAIWKKRVFREFPKEVTGEEEKSRIFANRN